MDGLDAAELDRLDSVLAAGSALTQSEPPKFEARCGTAALASSVAHERHLRRVRRRERPWPRGAFGRGDLAWAPRGDIVPE